MVQGDWIVIVNTIITLVTIGVLAMILVGRAHANPFDDHMESSCMLGELTHRQTACTKEAQLCGRLQQGMPNDRACLAKAWIVCYRQFTRSAGRPVDLVETDGFSSCEDKIWDTLRSERPEYRE